MLNKIEVEDYENGKQYTIPKFNKKLLEKLKEDNIKNIVIAKKDKENIEFLNNKKCYAIDIMELVLKKPKEIEVYGN